MNSCNNIKNNRSKKKLKILHIISSLKIGGAEVLLADLVKQLKYQDIENQVIYFHEGPILNRLHELGIPTHHIKGIFSLYDPVFFYRLGRLIKSINPDCIHTSLWAANFAGRLFGKLLGYPVTSAVHTDVAHEGFIRNTLDSCSYFLANHVVAVSNSVADSLNQKKWLPANKISVVKNGVNYETIHTKSKQAGIRRKDLGLSHEQFVIGSVGRLIPNKNYSLLIKVVQELKQQFPHIRLVLVGMGPEEQTLKTVIKEYNLAEYAQLIVGQESYGYYPLFDCFVLPSLQEGLSIAVLEALCFGLPVITSSITTKHDVIIHDQNGILINPTDSNELKNSIIKLITDKSFAKSIGLAGQNTVKKYDSRQMAESYQEIYSGLVHNNKI